MREVGAETRAVRRSSFFLSCRGRGRSVEGGKCMYNEGYRRVAG
jgi:hypothetical protein